MPRNLQADLQKRQKIQRYFYSVVGSVEHINIPKLQDAVRKEFHTVDNRLVEAQIRLMQAEGRIRVEEKSKVWIKQPKTITG